MPQIAQTPETNKPDASNQSRPVLSDEKKRELIDLAHKRAMLSANFFKKEFDEWIQLWKIYYKIRDEVEDNDDVDIKLSYAYAICQSAISKITEPILQTKPPFKTGSKNKKHDRQAEIFNAFARQYYSRPEYQLEATEANQELVVIGNSWEIDEYANQWQRGKRWEKTTKQGQMDAVVGRNNQMIPAGQSSYDYESYEEVDAQYPVRVGFASRFPSAFDVFPEPGVKRVRDMHWLLWQQREVALDDLREQMYNDPQTGELKPVYDLSEIDAKYGEHKPGQITPMSVEQYFTTKDFGLELRSAMGSESVNDNQQSSDMDKVHLMHVMEQGKIYTIANGQFVVKYQEFPYHFPWIPARLRRYVPHKEKLYGSGILQPIKEEIFMLDDITTLALRNWIRSINTKIAYHQDMIPFPDDFKSKAGGLIRVNKTERAADAFYPITQQDVTVPLINMQSNLKGFIEHGASVSDLSPGTEGTKQTHKTLGGLMEIQNELSLPFSTIRRLHLSNFIDQATNMYLMLMQFQFDKVPLPFYGPAGDMTIIEANRDDIDTGGLGFDYYIEEDPAAGDDAIARNQAMVFADLGMKYEQFRLSAIPQDPAYRQVARFKIDEQMRVVARKFGKYDTTSILAIPNDVVEPDQEFALIMQGTVIQPNPESDIVKHYLWHLTNRQGPEVQKMLQTGKILPQAMLAYDAFIQALGLMIQMVAADPMKIAQIKQQAAAVEQAGVPENE